MWRMAPRLMVLAAMFCAGTAYGDQPFFMGLGDLPGGEFRSEAFAVSADGKVVVGFSSTTAGLGAFQWTAETGIVGLGDLPGGKYSSFARGVSADGSVIVGRSDSDTDTEAFRWTAAEGMVGLGDVPPGLYGSRAEAVSADGSVIVGSNSQGAFRWTTESGMVGLGLGSATGISSDGKVIVGFRPAGGPVAIEAFRWRDSVMTGLGDFAGGDFFSAATAASSTGDVIVGYATSDRGTEAFRWTESDGLVGLGDLAGGGFYSEALSVSADGCVVAGISWASPASYDEAFVWDEAHGIRHLATVLATDFGLDLDGWSLRRAYVSADSLTFVGRGINPQGHIEAFVAHVPEPSCLTFLAFAGSGLMLRRRRDQVA